MLYGRIIGWGKAVPDKVLTNVDLEKMVDTSDEWIVTRTGIHERRIAPEGVTTATLSVEASQAALEKAGLIAADLDLIIVATSSPDHLLPAVSSEIQHQLGAHCGAFTLVAGCTGFVYALVTAQQFIATGAYHTILVVGAEVISRTSIGPIATPACCSAMAPARWWCRPAKNRPACCPLSWDQTARAPRI